MIMFITALKYMSSEIKTKRSHMQFSLNFKLLQPVHPNFQMVHTYKTTIYNKINQICVIIANLLIYQVADRIDQYSIFFSKQNEYLLNSNYTKRISLSFFYSSSYRFLTWDDCSFSTFFFLCHTSSICFETWAGGMICYIFQRWQAPDNRTSSLRGRNTFSNGIIINRTR